MNLYTDPTTALTLVRYHRDVIRDAFPRRRRRHDPLPPIRRATLSVVPGESSAAPTASRPDSTAA